MHSICAPHFNRKDDLFFSGGGKLILPPNSGAQVGRTLTFMAGKETVCDANTTRYGICVTLSNVLFGDVFLCSGQVPARHYLCRLTMRFKYSCL